MASEATDRQCSVYSAPHHKIQEIHATGQSCQHIAAVCVQLLTSQSPVAVLQAVSCPHLALAILQAVSCPHLALAVLQAVSCPHLALAVLQAVSCPHLALAVLQAVSCPHLALQLQAYCIPPLTSSLSITTFSHEGRVGTWLSAAVTTG